MTTTPTHEKTFPADESVKLPRTFVMRRLHSLLGVWLVIYLFEHLLVNSQSALIFEDDGSGFISMVNQIHNLPYLRVIELVFLGVPFLLHGVWGIAYLWTGKLNSFPSGGTKPQLPQYRRNHAYSWQRITSWILLAGIAVHVLHMRFFEYPAVAYRGTQKSYMVRVVADSTLYQIADKLGITFYDSPELQQKEESLHQLQARFQKMEASNEELYYREKDRILEEREWLQAAKKKPLKTNEVLAVAPNAGTAFLLVVRDAFKSPTMVVLYSILVVSAAFHGLNGLWTFMITWGVTLSRRSQKVMRHVTTVLMLLVAFLGLMAAWGTYWTTLT